jgi:DNA-binding transcriptional MocR family regulator
MFAIRRAISVWASRAGCLSLQEMAASVRQSRARHVTQRDDQSPLMGYPPLREAIARYLTISRGLTCTAEQIYITGGYRNNLTLILDALAARGDKVVIENPGYIFGQQLLKRRSKTCITRR